MRQALTFSAWRYLCSLWLKLQAQIQRVAIDVGVLMGRVAAREKIKKERAEVYGGMFEKGTQRIIPPPSRVGASVSCTLLGVFAWF